MLSLVLVDTRSGNRHAFEDVRKPLVLGSAVDCDLVLPEGGIPPHHCRLEPSTDGYRVVALESVEGVEVNGRWVGRAALNTGDVLRIGPFQVVISKAEAESSAEATPPPPPPPPRAPAPAPPSAPAEAVRPRPAPAAAAPVRAARTAGNGSASRGTPSRRSGRPATQSSSSAAAAGVGLLLVVVIAVLLTTTGNGDSGGEDDLFERQYEVARGWYRECRFDQLETTLQSLERQFAEDPSRLRKVRDLAERTRERRQRHGEMSGRLEEIRGLLRAGEFDRAQTLLDRVAPDVADLDPLRIAAEQIEVELEGKVEDPNAKYYALLQGSKTPEQWLTEAERQLGTEQYGRALQIVEALDKTSQGDSDRRKALRSRVQTEAEAAGRKLLAVVDSFLADHKMKSTMVAREHLRDEEIKNFRGTEIWFEMRAKGDEIEAVIAEQVPEELRPGSGGSSRRRASDSSRADRPSARDPGTEETVSEAALPSDVAAGGGAAPGIDPYADLDSRQCFDLAVRALQSQEFEVAVQRFEAALKKTADAGEISAISRYLDWALRPGFLAERLTRGLQEKPPREPLSARLRDGRDAQITGSDGARLVARIDGTARELDALLLTAADLLSLSGRVRLGSEDQVNRAFLALALGEEEMFLKSLAQAAGREELKSAVDSAVAFHRGLDQVPARGFFLVGDRWLTFEERVQSEILAEVRRAVTSISSDRGDRDASFAAITELAETAEDVVAEELRRHEEALKQRFLASSEVERIAAVMELREKLQQARAHALELIYDDQRYFYPYHDRQAEYMEVQREVETRVRAVRDLWGSEYDAEVPGTSVALSKAFRELLAELAFVEELLREVEGHEYQPDAELALARLLPEWTRTVNVRTLALDPAERDRLRLDQEVRGLNEASREKVEVGTDLDQVVVTNHYRVMMGSRRVAFNDKIYAAARGHSEWMARTGRFGHFNDEDPELRSPIDRMRKAGYRRGSGENVLRGGVGPRAAHERWFRSSGHHRNLLMASHTEMAAGQVGAFWTQNFGGGVEYTGNLIRE